jgi:hypothetical protein
LTTAGTEVLMRTMASSLRSALNDLASNFAAAVLDAIRGASLEDLLAETGDSAPRRRGPPPPTAPTTPTAPGRPARMPRSGRLKRRSPEDIADALDQVVALLTKNHEGLRAEQIRQQLGMQAKEMPRVLKEGLAKKVLRSRGQKRSTTYTTV